MHVLPMSDWCVFYEGGKDLCLAMHTDNGFLHWTKVTLVQPLQDFSSGRDLEGVVIDAVDGPLVL